MPESAGFKFGALVFSAPPGPAESTRMYGGKETFEGDLLVLVPEGQHAHWREWIGSVSWDRIRDAGRVVIARSSSETPHVVDLENKILQDQMRTAWAAYQLTGASEGEPWE